jgi:hypothetical protein
MLMAPERLKPGARSKSFDIIIAAPYALPDVRQRMTGHAQVRRFLAKFIDDAQHTA